jgi:hypothetical protein
VVYDVVTARTPARPKTHAQVSGQHHGHCTAVPGTVVGRATRARTRRAIRAALLEACMVRIRDGG